MRAKLWGLLLLLPFFLFVSTSLRADVTGSILGTVTDATGAVVSGVTVVATNLATNLKQTTVSDSVGQYRILALPVGHYKIEATASGFRKFLTPDVELSVDQQHRVDISLEVGTVDQAIEVSATAVQVETTNTQLGQVIDEKKVLNLPLNGRSYIDLLGLQAGVVPISANVNPNDRPVSGGLASGNISVNGQREQANAFLVNGGDVSEGRNLGTAVIPNLDSVAEFRLITNSFDAEYGKFSGAIMNAITKSGTNGLHGSAFEFLRNDKLDSRNFFDPSKGVFKRNQFGYAVGGPLWKNKLFWFTDYQGTRDIRGISSGLVQVPTAAQRAGAFGANAFVDSNGDPTVVQGTYWAQALSKRLGYQVTDGEPYNAVFPTGVIPQGAFSAPSQALMNYIPTPNTGSTYYATTGFAQRIRDDKAGQRVDFINKLTGNWSVYYFFDDSTLVKPFPGGNLPGFASTTPTRAQEAVLSNTKVFGPTAVNEWRVMFMRMATVTDKPQSGFGSLSDLGFQTGADTLGIVFSGPPGYEGAPPIYLNNFSFGNYTLTTVQPDNTWHFSEAFTKILGRHTMKFGGDYRYYQVNERNICAPNGSFSFDGSETGIDFADYLLGAPVGYTQCSMQFLDSRTRYGAAYAQDAFRIKPNLTLNYGLRWEVSMPWYDTQGKIETIVPGLQSVVFPTAPKGWVVPGDPGIPKTLAPTRYNNFAPRIGLAYSPGFTDGVLGKVFGGPGKTSIRAAFGIYYTSMEDLNLFYEVGDAPFGLYWPSILPPLFDEPFRTRNDGSSQTQRFPFVFPIPGDPRNKTLDYSIYLPIQGSPGFSIHNRLPYAEHYNLTIQRSLAKDTVLSLAYVGTQGHKLMSQTESNPGNAALCLSLRGDGVLAGSPECGPFGENGVYTRPDGTVINSTRGPLGPAFGSNSYTANIGNSNYNSFQATLERTAANFTFLAAYTFSKAIDNASGYNQSINFLNYRLSRALSSFDITHSFVVSYNYVVPFDRLSPSLPKRLTQGWSLNGITRFATGIPITIGQGGDRSLTGASGVDEPNFVGPLVFGDPRNGPYFNKNVFTSELIGQVGSSNRRFFHGPGLNNWDIGIHKDTRIKESMAIQFRVEFFNAFNHVQFNNPGGNFQSSLMGIVRSARDPRIGQMSLKFLW